jgi:hypothetical protein
MKKNFYTFKKHFHAIAVLLCALIAWSSNATAQVSVTATAGTTGPTAYLDLSSAFTAINSGTHQGDIIVEISASFVDPNIAALNSSGSGSAVYTSVLVRPIADGLIMGGTTPQGRGVLELNGTDSVIIDGDNPNTAGINRNLTITNAASSTTTYTSVIRVATSGTAPFADANSITIKNLIINGSAAGRNLAGVTSTTGSENTTFGIMAGPNGGSSVTAIASVTTGMTTGAAVNNFAVQNCSVMQCARAIAFIGGTSASSSGVTITNNLIGDQAATLSGAPPFISPSSTVYTKGIIVQGTTAVTISGNTIKNMLSYVSTNMNGIELTSAIGSGTIAITNNSIDGIVLNAANSSGAHGIVVANAGGPYTISGNNISHLESSSASSTNQPGGIDVSSTATSATIENNTVTKVYDRGTSSYGAHGIVLRAGSNVTIRNNTISDINQDMSTSGSFGATWSVFGIKIGGGTGHMVYHNSVNLFGTTLGASVNTSQSSFAFCISTTAITGCDVRNNIFANTITGGHSLTDAHTAIFLPSGGTTTMNLTLNNNAYYCGTNDSMQGVAQIGGTAGTGLYKLSNFNAASITPANNLRAYTQLLSVGGTNDNASIAFNSAAPFTSTTNLHIPAATLTALESTGATTSLTVDMDGDARPGPAGSVNGGAMAPDIGADESDMIPFLEVVDSSNVDQIVAEVLPGTANQQVLRMRVYISGFINPLTLSSLKLSTGGSTAAADIDNAHIYYTGASSTFSTATPFGSAVAAPNGTFYAAGTQVLNKGINYLWLTYDVAAGAGLLNVLDGVLDSLLISGVNYAPVNGNPAGNITITNPMTYVSSTTTQPNVSKVGQGSVNNLIIGMQVVTSPTGTPINVTQLDFNTGSTTDTSNIRNIKVWYTGTGSTFATTTQFGATMAALPGTLTFSVTGTQAITNGTNYFWLTYDIDAASTVGNVVDAECSSITVDAIPQAPTVTAPAGSREIRVEYCPPTYTYPCSNGDFVNHFSTTGAANNISFLSTGCNNPGNSYNYYQSQTISAYKASTFTISYRGSGVYGEGFKIWIDYNQDGVFAATEVVASAPSSTLMNNSVVTIPCDALTGVTRLRIRDVYNAMPATACSVEAYGEAEDYDVNILDNPVQYISSTAVQQTGLVSPGNTDKPVLRIPVKVAGCGVAIATTLSFNTAATTNAATDITSAKLYVTGNSTTFNTSKLVGTVVAPAGAFSFAVTDTLINNDTTNYWLAYDITGGATITNILDARIDSIEILGAYQIPTIGDPAGSISIEVPMTYVSSTAAQTTVSKVARGSANNEVIKVEVITSATGAPVSLTDLTFNATGTTDTANIRNMKVWYTGSTNTFGTAAQLGSTLSVLPGSLSFTISGNQPLTNGSNYFWLTYDIDAAATTGNVIDGECTSLTFGGASQTPTVTAPAGSRTIRLPYCVPVQSGTALIKNVTFNTLHYSAATATAPFYRTFAAIDSATTTAATSQTYNLSVTTATNASISVWIDYNDDGTFSPSEWQQVASTSTANVASIVPVTIPCGSASGELRMRIRTRTATLLNGPTEACVTFTGGETQDYTITLTNTPVNYAYSTAVQQSGNVAPGTNDNAVLRIPVRMNGCGVATLTSLNLATTGSTNASDIIAAKLYTTGNSAVFNTNEQVGSTVFGPSGAFSFNIADTLLNNDTTNYWLAYDVNPGATMGNVLDAKVDSMEILGAYYIPSNGNPAGSLLIDAPMTYVNAVTTQSVTSKVGQNTSNNHIVGIEVVTSATGSVVNLSQLDFNTNGTTDTSNIRNIKVWYTGSSNMFATTTQLGTTLDVLPGTTTFSIAGTQSLINGSNYFWLSYDIAPAATIGNMVDAECISVTVDAAPHTPSVTAPAGAQQIRANYCEPPYTTGCSDGDFVNNFATTGAITNISNLGTGCNPNANSFIYYPSQVVTVSRGSSFTINYRGSGDWPEGHKVWIDFDQDGVFSATEQVAASAPTTNASTATVTIPMTAGEGFTRLRIRNVYNAQPVTSCSSETWGETEDYNVYIMQAPAAVEYTWNKTTPDTFSIAANWTPARTSYNLNDVLKFDAGVPVSVYAGSNQVTGQMVIDNNTTVTFSSPASTMITVADTLKLLSGKVVTGNNLTLSVGTDAVATGVLTGSGTIEGLFRKWISATTAAYTIPLTVGANNRSAMVTFTTAPSTGGTLTARFINGTTTTGGLPVTEGSINVTKLCPTGYWSIASGDGLAGGTYDIAITAEGFFGVTSYTNLVLMKRGSNVLPWLLSGTHITTAGSNAIPVLSRTGVTGFSEFAVGGDSTVNPLPVKLLSFTAQESSGDVLLRWTTASEVNNKEFALERVNVKGGWEEIWVVKGKGNSNIPGYYSYTDPSPFTSLPAPLYYRLKQVDVNGTFAYSNMVSVSNKQTAKTAVSCYPNPFTAAFTLAVQSAENTVANIEIADVNGRIVWKKQLPVTKGSNTFVIDDIAVLMPGMYIVKVVSGNETVNLKLTKTY